MEGYGGHLGDGLQPYNKDGDAKGGNKTEIIRNSIISLVGFSTANLNYALDVGCGNGRASSILADFYDKVLAIDKNSTFDDRFKSKKIKFKQTTFDKLESGKFDLILFWASFYLMWDFKKALKKAADMLTEGGIIIIGDDPTRAFDRTENPNKNVKYNLGEAISFSGLKELHEDIGHYRITLLKND